MHWFFTLTFLILLGTQYSVQASHISTVNSNGTNKHLHSLEFEQFLSRFKSSSADNDAKLDPVNSSYILLEHYFYFKSFFAL